MTYPLVDIGVNLTNKAFHNEHQAVVSRAIEAGVKTLVITGTDEHSSEAAVGLCENLQDNFENCVFSTCGVHPHDASDFTAATLANLQDLSRSTFVKAIGETGLDFNRDFSPRPQQERAFEQQLELAINTGLPVFMHERDAYPRFFDIIKSYREQLADAVVHCFTGNKQALFSYLDLDLHIGITGWICDERRGQELQELVKNIPLSRMMLESDAPYLLPRTIKPKPKHRQNEPAFLPYVLNTVAEHYPASIDEIAEQTTTTSQRFFRID